MGCQREILCPSIDFPKCWVARTGPAWIEELGTAPGLPREGQGLKS